MLRRALNACLSRTTLGVASTSVPHLGTVEGRNQCDDSTGRSVSLSPSFLGGGGSPCVPSSLSDGTLIEQMRFASTKAKARVTSAAKAPTVAAGGQQQKSSTSSIVDIAKRDLSESGKVLIVAGWLTDTEIESTQGQLTTNPLVKETLARRSCAFLNPITGETKKFTKVGTAETRTAIQEWLVQQNPKKSPMALIPFQEDGVKQLLTVVASVMGHQQEVAVSVSIDAWSLVIATFQERKRTVPGLALPVNMVDAFFKLSNTPFIAPTNKDDDIGMAHLTWQTMLNLYLKLGASNSAAGGPKKRMSPVDQILRKAVQPVIPITLSVRMLENHEIKIGTAAKVKVSAFNCVTGVKKNFSLTSLSGDKNLVNVATALSETDTISLIIPTPTTEESAVRSLVKGIRPRCPLIMCPPVDLVKAGLLTNFPPEDILAKVTKESLKVDELWGNLQIAAGNSIDKLRLWTTQVGEAKKPKTFTGLGLIPRQEIEQNTPKHAREGTVKSEQEMEEDAIQTASSSRASSNRPLAANPTIAGTKMHPHIIEKLMKYEKFLTDPDRRKREEAAALPYKRWCVVDIETTTVRSYKRTANPFDPKNHVCLVGLLDYKGKMVIPSAYSTKSKPYKLPDLSGYDALVGHNIKFDLQHLWKDPQLIKFFARGGKIWDTMYGEYLVTGHQTMLGMGAGLDDVAKKYGGTIVKLDEVKQAWARGVDTMDIPHATLAKYLEGDLKNTETIFNNHMKRAVEQHQMISASYRMDGLLCTTEMEFNGLQIDKEACADSMAKVIVKGAAVKKALEAAKPIEMGPVKPHFNWGSTSHLISYFFGGPVVVDTGSRLRPSVDRESINPDTINELKTDVEVGNELFVGPPTDPSVGAACIYLAKHSPSKSNRLFKYYIEPCLRLKGFRANQSLPTVFPTESEEVEAKYVSIFAAFSGPDGKTSKITSRKSFNKFLEEGFNHFTLKVFPTGGVKPANRELTLTCRELNSGKGKSKLVDFLETLVSVKNESTKKEILFLTPNSSNTPMNAVLSKIVEGAYAANFPVVHKTTTGKGETVIDAKASAQAMPPTIGFADMVVYHNFLAKDFPTILDPTAQKINVKGLPPAPLANSMCLSNAKNWIAASEQLLSRTVGPVLAESIEYEQEAANKFQAEMESTAADKKKINKDSASTKTKIVHRDFFLSYTPSDIKEIRTNTKAPTLASVMAVFGASVATAGLDVFELPTSCPPNPVVQLEGKLLEVYPEIEGLQGQENRLKRMAVTNEFTSVDTKKLQVGIKTLKWFAKKGDHASKLIEELREHEKMLSTYYDDTSGGMMSLVHEHDSRIHHELQHNKTQTGRLASSNPNCQNIAKDGDLRRVFVSRFGKDGVCIEADYSQLEVIGLAALSEDKQMIEDIQNKIDFHCKRVTIMRPDLTYAEVVRKAKVEKDPEYAAMRQKAKGFSFQRQYGAGPRSISESTGLSLETVNQMIQGEKLTYSGAEDFGEMVKASVGTFNMNLQDGDRNKDGEILMKGRFVAPTGQAYVFKEQDKPDMFAQKGVFRARDRGVNFSPTKLKNYPVQGFAGEIVQYILGTVFRHYVQKKNYQGKAFLTNTVHDCIWIDARKEIMDEVCRDLERLMTSVRTFLNANWPEIGCQVEFPVEVVAGQSMGDLKEVHTK